MKFRRYLALVLSCLMFFTLPVHSAYAAQLQTETAFETGYQEETELEEEIEMESDSAEESEIETPDEREIETEINETEIESEIETETETEFETIIETETESETEIESESELETETEEMSLAERENYMARMGSTMEEMMQGEALARAMNASSTCRTRFSGMTRLDVIDVSEFQGTIDWKKVKAVGIDGVFLRVGGRGYTSGSLYSDSNFFTHIKGAKSAGLKVGVYFFSQAISNAEAVAEANYTLSRISGYTMNLPVMIDYEWNGGQGFRTDNNASKTVRTGIMRAFCETIENAGYEAGVYAAASWFSDYIDGTALAKEYNIWIAQIGVSYPGGYYNGVIDGWQYSWTGKIDGIEGATDVDYWYVANGSKTFKDVYSASLYYYKAVYWALENGITNGYFHKSWFKPADSCTREQMVTFLWRMAGSPEPSGTSNPFTDVAADTYYYKAVLWAAQKGITKGYSNGTFGVGKVCLREHAMTFLWRLAGSPAASGSSGFSDIKSSAYYYNAVLWGCENGITKGYSDGSFGPARNCLREHVITFLYRYDSL